MPPRVVLSERAAGPRWPRHRAYVHRCRSVKRYRCGKYAFDLRGQVLLGADRSVAQSGFSRETCPALTASDSAPALGVLSGPSYVLSGSAMCCQVSGTAWAQATSPADPDSAWQRSPRLVAQPARYAAGPVADRARGTLRSRITPDVPRDQRDSSTTGRDCPAGSLRDWMPGPAPPSPAGPASSQPLIPQSRGTRHCCGT